MELLVWALTGAAVVVLLRRSRAGSTIALAIALLATTAVGHAMWTTQAARRQQSDAALRAHLPTARPGDGYVSSDACAACHPSQYASWHRSYHRTMTQTASAATVRAPFAGETLVGDDGRRYRLRRDGDELWVDVDGSARRLGLVTGSHHMQAFWLPGARGNEQIEFPFTWLVDDARWVARRDVFLVGCEYTKQPSRWNQICVECHATGARPGLDARAGTWDSRAAELGIACEACHGPGAAHVAANHSPLRRVALHEGDGADATIVNPARLSPARAAEVCGQCHGIGCPPDRWLETGIGFRPGQPLAATKPILRYATLGESACRRQIAGDPSFAPSRFWRDGMVRISGREYNGLVESPCFRRGTLTCVSCHTMHDGDPSWQLRGDGEGNGTCTQCHRALATNVEAHTHHRAGSTGSNCQNCHMPHTTYGLMRAMRSHQISVPRVQDDVDAGRPNACNLCHLDRTLRWTAAALRRWYGTPAPTLTRDQETIAASILDAARGEAGVRVLIAWALGWDAARAASGDAWMAPLLAELLGDEYAPIRYNAIRALRKIAGFADLPYDYVAAPAARWTAQQEARARWQRRSVPAEARRGELLLDGDGGFARDTLERLLLDRPEDDEMFLAE